MFIPEYQVLLIGFPLLTVLISTVQRNKLVNMALYKFSIYYYSDNKLQSRRPTTDTLFTVNVYNLLCVPS